MSDVEVSKVKARVIGAYYLIGAAVMVSGAWNAWGWEVGMFALGVAVMTTAVLEAFS